MALRILYFFQDLTNKHLRNLILCRNVDIFCHEANFMPKTLEEMSPKISDLFSRPIHKFHQLQELHNKVLT